MLFINSMLLLRHYYNCIIILIIRFVLLFNIDFLWLDYYILNQIYLDLLTILLFSKIFIKE